MNIFDEFSNEKGVLIHHWDTDGIMCSVLLHEYINAEMIDFVPTIGNYHLIDDEIQEIKSKLPDFIIVADMSLPSSTLQLLHEITSKMIIFDHHAGEMKLKIRHINPVADGETAERYPSAGWVINEYASKDQNIYSVLGAIGDKGRALSNCPIVQKILKGNGISYETAILITKYIDSCYITNDSEGIHSTVRIIQNFGRDMKRLLDVKMLEENIKKIDIEMERISNECIQTSFIDEKVRLYELNTPYNLISRFTREMSDRNPESVIFTIDHMKGSIYVRRKDLDIDFSSLIEWGKGEGLNIGGKKEVLGINSEPPKVPLLKELLIKKLEKILICGNESE